MGDFHRWLDQSRHQRNRETEAQRWSPFEDSDWPSPTPAWIVEWGRINLTTLAVDPGEAGYQPVNGQQVHRRAEDSREEGSGEGSVHHGQA